MNYEYQVDLMPLVPGRPQMQEGKDKTRTTEEILNELGKQRWRVIQAVPVSGPGGDAALLVVLERAIWRV